MNTETGSVLIIEDNQTRADLYALWLDEFQVQIAATKQQSTERLDDDVSVVVLAQEFADGAAEPLLDVIHAETKTCEVITTTTDRAQVFPKLDVDHHLVKPVFRDELVQKVSMLMRRVRYKITLTQYYRLAGKLSSYTQSENPKREIYNRLRNRCQELQMTLNRLRAEMDEEDISAVIGTVTPESANHRETGNRPKAESNGKPTESKYCPARCSHCKREWDVAGHDSREKGYKKLAAHVYRCVDCGHVRMKGHPSQRVSGYR